VSSAKRASAKIKETSGEYDRDLVNRKLQKGYESQPLIRIFLSTGPKNNAYATIGTMFVISSRGSASVPIVSGDKTHSPIKTGIFLNRPTKPSSTSGAKEILMNQFHGGSKSVYVRIYEDFLEHQANNKLFQEDAYTYGCVGVTAIRGTGTTAQSNKAIVDSLIDGQSSNWIITYE
jgi:hypothetical protein